MSIEGTLGNFRLRDVSLGAEHCWEWLCDIRNPGAESLIKVLCHLPTSLELFRPKDVAMHLFLVEKGIVFPTEFTVYVLFSVCFQILQY